MVEHPVKPRAISMLAKIRQVLMEDDGSLALMIADCGKYVAGDMLADTIAAIQRTEQQCCKLADQLHEEREVSEMYQSLLGDYYPDTMTDAQKEEITALVAKWDEGGKSDENDRGDQDRAATVQHTR